MDRKHLEKQFTDKVKNSQGIVHKVCHMYGKNEDHRKDLFQEIMVQLWRSFPSFRGESQFSSWMYRVALNVAIQDFRKIKKRELIFFKSYEFMDVEDVAYDPTKDEQLRTLHQAIGHLDKLDKAIIMLHLDGNGNEIIGDIVGITPNYVRVKMNRIKKKISEKIKD
ncbi:MAG: sigma-70 family RNA polymerase sigma factor [Ekhidna sp.]|uniref:RNA polymerase sigma factor n=1 Tax=Ekhidna sp. TaxID=2608089 RepID=UPI0032EF3513